MPVLLDPARSTADLMTMYGDLAPISADQRAYRCLAGHDPEGYAFWLQARDRATALLQAAERSEG